MSAQLPGFAATSTERVVDANNERENSIKSNHNLQTPIMNKNMTIKMSDNNCNQYGIGEEVNNFETDQEHDKDREITDSPFNNINISSINPSYSISSSINSSLTASMNISSFLSLNESNINDISNPNNNEINKVSKVWNDLNSIRDEHLFEIKHKMSDFKHALTLWNEGGFIPLFTNFISWINEANIEINTLSQRLTNTTLLFQRFVKKYNQKIKTKQLSPNQNKINNDLKFENDALKKENEWLRKQLMDLTSTLSTSHQQIKSIQNKENLNSSKFLESIDKMENNMINDDEYDSHFKMENVTIFETLSPQKNEIIYRPKTKKMRLSNSCRTRSTLNNKNNNINNNNTNNDNSWKKKLRQRKVSTHIKKKSEKIPLSRSRSYRQSKQNTNNVSSNRNNKQKTPKSQVMSRSNSMKTRRKSEPRPSQRNIKSKLNITKNEIKSSKKKKKGNDDKTKMIKMNAPKIVTKSNNVKKSRRSLSTLNISSIRKPSASLRRLSYSNAS